MFQEKLFLRAYDITSSDKPFRSEAPKKQPTILLTFLLRKLSSRTPKLSVSGNLRNT